jgi:hypothetical protein
MKLNRGFLTFSVLLPSLAGCTVSFARNESESSTAISDVSSENQQTEVEKSSETSSLENSSTSFSSDFIESGSESLTSSSDHQESSFSVSASSEKETSETTSGESAVTSSFDYSSEHSSEEATTETQERSSEVASSSERSSETSVSESDASSSAAVIDPNDGNSSEEDGYVEPEAMAFKQKNQRTVDKMPFVSDAYIYEDWNSRAKKLDSLLFEFAKNPEYVEPSYEAPYGPIGYWDKSNSTFGLPSYLGHVNGDQTEGTMRPGRQESLPVVNAVYGASLCGIDKSKQTFVAEDGQSYTYDFVSMLRPYYSYKYKVFTNNVGGAPGDSFWYDLYPHILISRICELYPEIRDDASSGLSLKQMLINSASNWLSVSKKMLKSDKITYSSYDFDSGEFTIDSTHIEPPLGGFLYVFYNAYQLSGDTAYLSDGIIPILDWLETHNINPNFEIMSDYIPYVASIMNYRFKKNYNVDRYLNFLIENDSDCRPGMGLSCAKWGDFDAYGLATFQMKNTDNSSGYAFLMNTFHLLSTLVPMLNYSPSYANIVGKWILNVTNGARIFYGEYMDSSHQSCDAYSIDPEQLIGYEGCRSSKKINKTTMSPYACGDPTSNGWGQTDYGIYGSSLVGVFGGLVSKTNQDKILRTDLSKADSLSENSYQSYLYYNPYEESKDVSLIVSKRCDVFDVTNNRYIAKNAFGGVKLSVPARGSLIVKLLPTNSKVAKTSGAKGINASHNGYYVCGKENISMFGRPCLNLDTKITPKASYSDYIDLGFASQVSSGDAISKFEVYVNGTPFDSLSYSDSYRLDVSKMKDNGISGDTLVTFKAYSQNYGLSDSVSIRINIE